MKSKTFEEKNLFLYVSIGVIFLSIVFVAVDAYLLHRTYQYFGGGALNRPYALSNWTNYTIFIAISIFNASVFWGTLALTSAKYLLPKLKYTTYQSILICYAIFTTIQFIYIISKWQIFTYFSNSFDFDSLKQLSTGSLLNIFPWVSAEQFVMLPVAVILFISIFLIAKSVKRNQKLLLKYPKHSKLLFPFVLCGMILIHLPCILNESIHYGLKQQIPYIAVQKILEIATDFDGDGFGPLTTPSDPDNFNADIYPYAIDIPGNGIDENGLAGDLESLPMTSAPLVISHHADHKNVIVIVVETFRTDIFDMVLDGKMVMPFLNAIGHKYAYTLDAFSNHGVTGPAIQTILAGNLHYNATSPYLFDIFKDAGYKTYVISAQDESWGNTRNMLRMKEVDSYYDATNMKWDESTLTTWEKMNRNGLTLSWSQINKEVRETLQQNGKNKFFMYLNYQELHYPYYKDSLPKEFISDGHKDAAFFVPQNRHGIIRQYANAANYLDKGIKDLIAYLKINKQFENTVIVITGDHPDSFYENGLLGHAWSLNEYQRRTPLVVINGKGRYSTPIGQDEIASLIINTLNKPLQSESSFVIDKDKQLLVMQGGLEKPIRIGWMGENNLFTFDFRTMMVQESESEPWTPIEKLSNDGHKNFNSLIHKWETENFKAHHAYK